MRDRSESSTELAEVQRIWTQYFSISNTDNATQVVAILVSEIEK